MSVILLRKFYLTNPPTGYLIPGQCLKRNHYPLKVPCPDIRSKATSPGREISFFVWHICQRRSEPWTFMIRSCHLRESNSSGITKHESTGATKTDVVVPFVRVVPVAVSTAGVILVVVPRAAPEHLRLHPFERPRCQAIDFANDTNPRDIRGRSSFECFGVLV
jgi:hypothetical protein